MSIQNQPENTKMAEDRESTDPLADIEKQIADLRAEKAKMQDPVSRIQMQDLIDAKEAELKRLTEQGG